MPTVRVRYYAELNDLLPLPLRQVEFDVTLDAGAATVRGLLAAQGVPGSAVDLVLVDGDSASLERPLRDGARVSVFPVFEAIDVAAQVRLRERPLRRTRFVVVPELRRLAIALRLLGFDTTCAPEGAHGAGAAARGGGRILLTRDPEVIASSAPTHALRVFALAPRAQLREVLRRLHLPGRSRLTPRCPRCNRALVEAGTTGRCPVCGHRLGSLAGQLRARLHS